jgi:two-component sensor histidine kinase
LDAEDVYLDVDQAVPCGLIANELLSNALKHAFPGDRSGRIEMQMLHRERKVKRKSSGEFVLTVKDNGVGFPQGFDLKNSQSMGMKLASSLTRQLNGKMEVDQHDGACLRITFPEPSGS